MKRSDLKLGYIRLIDDFRLPYYEGWDVFLNTLLERAEAILVESGIPASDWPKASVYEKVGTLRINFSRTRLQEVDGKLGALTAEAYTKSSNICIFCGCHGRLRGFNPETMHVYGWIHPACDRCEALSIRGQL